MKHVPKISYKIIDDPDSNGGNFKKLKCSIDENQSVIFEFSGEALRWKLNLEKDSSADDLYGLIKNFLSKQLEENILKDRYQIKSDNFSEICNI